MLKQMTYILVFIFSLCATEIYAQQPEVKVTTDITIDKVGDAVLEFNTKYNSMGWDMLAKNIGTNTSILSDNLKKQFPKYILTDYNYTQNANDKTNRQTVKMMGMMSVTEDGKWSADLDSKNPEITKVNDEEYVLVSDGASMKIHLPPGTTDSKVEKDNFNKAILTYPVKQDGGMGMSLMLVGLAIVVGGSFLLYKKLKQPQSLRTIYEPAHHQTEIKDRQPQQAKPVLPLHESGKGVEQFPEEFPQEKSAAYNNDIEQ